MPEFLTCTERLQQWNCPCGHRVPPIPVDQLGNRCRELFPTHEHATGSQLVFDPCPLSHRQPDPLALETLRCDLISLGQPSGFLSVIVSTLEKIRHDNHYCGDDQQTKQYDELPSDLPPFTNTFQNVLTTEADVLTSLNISADQRIELEKKTRNQGSSALWHEARRQRITGSKCGRILQQKEKTVALLLFCVYPKPMLTLPKPIAFGRKNEEKACKSYVNYMIDNGHLGLQTEKSGFVVHPGKCWLGASPDAWVTDPSVTASSGIAEFKCPYQSNSTSRESQQRQGLLLFCYKWQDPAEEEPCVL